MRESTIIANMQRVDKIWEGMQHRMFLIGRNQELLLKLLVDKKIITSEEIETTIKGLDADKKRD
jgi:hypothetical protein